MIVKPKPLVICERCGERKHVAWSEIAAYTRAHPAKCPGKLTRQE